MDRVESALVRGAGMPREVKVGARRDVLVGT